MHYLRYRNKGYYFNTFFLLNSNICCCVIDIVQTVSGSDFALNCQKTSVKQLCIECCLTCSGTLGLLGNVSRSSPTSSIMAAEGGSRLFGPVRKASRAAGFCFKSTQEHKDVSYCDK